MLPRLIGLQQYQSAHGQKNTTKKSPRLSQVKSVSPRREINDETFDEEEFLLNFDFNEAYSAEQIDLRLEMLNDMTPQKRRQLRRQAHETATEKIIQERMGTGKAVKTFDPDTGKIQVSHFGIPKRQLLINRHYLEFKNNAAKMMEVESFVARMPLKKQKNLAVKSALRKHQEEFERMVDRDVFAPSVSFQRAQIMYRMAVHNMVGHFDSDIRELSLIRILSGATDAVIYMEAEKLADQEIKRLLAKVVPDNTTRVDLLGMSLDAFRRAHVPEPPRTIVEAPAPTARQRRASIAHRSSFIGTMTGRISSSVLGDHNKDLQTVPSAVGMTRAQSMASKKSFLKTASPPESNVSGQTS